MLYFLWDTMLYFHCQVLGRTYGSTSAILVPLCLGEEHGLCHAWKCKTSKKTRNCTIDKSQMWSPLEAANHRWMKASKKVAIALMHQVPGATPRLAI
jgi:hypothetical protein